MRLTWVKWLTVIVPVTAVVALDLLLHFTRRPGTVLALEEVVFLSALLIGAFLLSHYVFRLFEQRESKFHRATRDLSNLNALSQSTRRTGDLDETVASTLGRLLDLLEARAGALYLLQEGRDRLTLAGYRGMAPETARDLAASLADPEALDRALRQGEPTLTRASVLEDNEIRGYLVAIIPLRSGDKRLGAAVVLTDERRGWLQAPELLEATGYHLGVSIDNARLMAAARQREAEAAALYQMGLEVSAQLEPEQVLQSLIDRTRRLLNSVCVGLALVDDTTQELVLRVRSDSEGGAACDHLVVAEGTVPMRVVASGREYVHNCQTHGNQKMACTGVPLKLGARTIGSLCAGRACGAGGGYNWSGLLSQVANLATISLTNANLYQQTQRHLGELEALHQTAVSVGSILELEPLLETILDHAVRLTGADGGSVMLLEAASGDLVVQTVHGRPSEPRRKLTPAEGLAGLAFRTRAPVRTGNARAHPYYRAVEDGPELKSLVCIPLDGHGTVIGVLSVSSHTRYGAFDDRQQGLLEALAALAAVAIENAGLYRQAQNLAVLEERDRIAREMHDSLAQVLGYLTLKSRAARGLLGAGANDQAATELEEMTQVADEAYTDVREAILGLRESLSPTAGLAETLTDYLRKYSRQSGIASRLEVPDGVAPRFAPEVEVQLLRMVQEALTNVRKHSGASEAVVRLEAVNGSVRVAVEDNGRGFEVRGMAGDEGFGLYTMRERVEGVGGSFEITSAPGRGTRVTAKLPREGGD